MVSNGVRSILSTMRKHNRRTVIQAVTLKVDRVDFDCTAYDISLGGIRLKVDMPIEHGTGVFIQIKNRLRQAARVIWSADGFIGLNFVEDPEKIRVSLGSLGNGLS
ncbi:MAG: PilZ domain-containing protein [Alphaproteobacteria bacterium]|nr:PilZ domain-containing protein [Alphaproteobacteria bacterium]